MENCFENSQQISVKLSTYQFLGASGNRLWYSGNLLTPQLSGHGFQSAIGLIIKRNIKNSSNLKVQL